MKSASLRRIAIALLLTLLFAAGTPIQAQPSDRPRSSVATDYRVRLNTDLIVTWAQVRSRKDGAPVLDLGIDDFALREDGQPQRISLVKEGEPLSVVVLLQGRFLAENGFLSNIRFGAVARHCVNWAMTPKSR